MTGDKTLETKPAPGPSDFALSAILEASPPAKLLHDEEQEEDRFGSLEIARRLVPLIRRVPPPFTISVSGAWGVGKTTLMRRVADLLREEESHPNRIPVIEVDLWTEDLGDLRRRLALEVAVALSEENTTDRSKMMRDQAKDFDERLRASATQQAPPQFHLPDLRHHWQRLALTFVVVAVVVFTLSGVTAPAPPGGQDQLGLRVLLTGVVSLGVWLLVSSGLVFSVTSASTTTPPLQERIAFLQRFRDMVSSATQRRVLIIIDNIDRLSGEDAVAVLADVRAFVEVEQSRCIFVVPIDRDALVRHLSRTMGGEDQTARDYLEKFFNLDVLLTKPVRADLRAWTRDDLVARLFGRASREVVSLVAELIAEAADGSPRASKRIANALFARAYLLPVHERAMSLADLAFVEALLARFPAVLGPLQADPRRWLEFAERMRASADEAERSLAARELAGLPQGRPPSGDAGTTRMLESLRRFVLFPASLPEEADLRTILAVRSDRQWAGVSNAKIVQAALNEGDAVSLRRVLDEAPPQDRATMIRSSLDALRVDQQQGWRQGVVRQLNALAGAVSGDDPAANELIRVAAEFLLTAETAYYAQLTSDTVDLLFTNLDRLPHRDAIVDRVHNAMATVGDSDATALIDAIAVISTTPATVRIQEIAELLNERSDSELGPAFSRPAEPRVLIALYPKYAEVMGTWDGTQDVPTVELAALRFRQIVALAEVVPEEDVDRIASQAVLALPGVESDALPALEHLVVSFRSVDPSSAIDAFARALIDWSPGGIRGLELALQLPISAAVLAAPASRRLLAADAGDFSKLRASRERLDSIGVPYAEAAMARWANGKGNEYALWAVEGNAPDDLEHFKAGLALVVDEGMYAAYVGALAPHLTDETHRSAAQLVIDDIARRIPKLRWSTQAELAATVHKLQANADSSTLLGALRDDLVTSDADDIDEAIETALAFAEAGIAGADTLPALIAGHAATIGVGSPRYAPRLLRQSGVAAEDVRTACVGAIQRLPAASVLPELAAVRRSLNKSVAIGVALVERASREAPGNRLGWLQEAARWKTPKHRELRQAYQSALDVALEGDDQVEATVRELRNRLSSSRI